MNEKQQDTQRGSDSETPKQESSPSHERVIVVPYDDKEAMDRMFKELKVGDRISVVGTRAPFSQSSSDSSADDAVASLQATVDYYTALRETVRSAMRDMGWEGNDGDD